MPQPTRSGTPEGSGALADRVVLVTGGSGDLGRSVVKTLLEAGGSLHVPIFAEDEIPALEGHLGDAMASIELHPEMDLTDPGKVEALFERIEDRAGRSPDVVVNLAGGFGMAQLEETSPEEWARLWQMNATTNFLVSRAALPGMKARRWGRIVNVSALPALDRGKAGLAAYGAAKAAVLSLTQTIAREGVTHGIAVNAILPSIIDTPANRESMPDADTRRWLPPARIARVIRFLASEDAGILNGAALPLTLGPP